MRPKPLSVFAADLALDVTLGGLFRLALALSAATPGELLVPVVSGTDLLHTASSGRVPLLRLRHGIRLGIGRSSQRKHQARHSGKPTHAGLLQEILLILVCCGDQFEVWPAPLEST